MVFTDAQLKGNWAEQYIAEQLSKSGCLIRHVTQGHDSGIDLYCETTENGEPFLHFWCQIKTKNRWKGKIKQLKYSERKKTIKYWLKQPIPVLIFLIPDLRNEPIIPFYICNPLEFLFEKSIKSFIKIKNQKDLSQFLYNDLKILTYIWELKDGKVSHLKTPDEGYTKEWASYFSQAFEPRLRTSIYYTLNRLSFDLIFSNRNEKFLEKIELDEEELKQIKKAKPYILTLNKYVNEINDQHYENYVTIGLYFELINKYENALSNMKKALDIIENDKKIDYTIEPWNNVYEEIKENIRRINNKKVKD